MCPVNKRAGVDNVLFNEKQARVVPRHVGQGWRDAEHFPQLNFPT